MPRKPPPAKHLTAAMRVLRFHLARPALTAVDAQHVVKDLAHRLDTKEASKDDFVLEEKLRKATRVTVAELANFAKDWPNV
jgi:hypothetical protein